MVDYIIDILAKVPALDSLFNFIALLPKLLRSVITGLEQILNILNQGLIHIEDFCMKIGKKKEELTLENKDEK